jgi:hypothetical protein
MLKPTTWMLAAGVLTMPLAAYADCAERIAAVESHPAIVGTEDGEEEARGSDRPAAGSEEQVVEEELVENGERLREYGGETVHAEGGPAAPREHWFTAEPDRSAALSHLDAAKDAQRAGDEAACMEAIQQAEEVIEDGSG